MGKTEHRIAYKAGITRTPSDFLCGEGELAECINLTTDHEELKVMTEPAEWLRASNGSALPDILYIHRINGDELVIGARESSGTWTLESGRNVGGVYSSVQTFTVGGAALAKAGKPTGIVSVGRILVVSYPDGTYYMLWDPTTGSYKVMSPEFPEIEVEFSLTDRRQVDPGRPASFSISSVVHHETVVNPSDTLSYYRYLTTESEQEYETIKDMLVGAVSQRIGKVAEQKRFAFPFWARYAVRLFDGRYTHISQPFLLFPTVNHNCDIFFSDTAGVEQNLYMRDWSDGQNINYKPFSAELACKIISSDLTDWSDIIAGVDIFVSEQQTPFNLEGDWHFINPFHPEHQDGVLYNHADGPYGETTITPSSWDGAGSGLNLGFVTYFGLTHLSDTDIMRGLTEKSQFYRIAQIDLDDFGNYAAPTSLSDRMTQSTLRTLTSQIRLDHDDYFSRNSMTARVMKAYNKRLHLARISRSFFDGFSLFSGAGFGPGSSVSYRIAVSIKTDSGMRLVVKDTNQTDAIMNIWFYYPDPRATKVQIYKKESASEGYLLYDFTLTEHEGLNGSYFLDHLPSSADVLPSGTALSPLPEANKADEVINDHVFVSEVDNPFVFTSKGDIKVGQGDIVGLATQTVSLGQEEHGIHPLVVFTDRGVCILRVDNEGYYLRSDELNREVCLKQASITETDGPVFFVSQKGLMALVGSEVRCVSGQMNGIRFDYGSLGGLSASDLADPEKPGHPWSDIIVPCKDETSFAEFVTDDRCRIAYDYTDSRLWLIRSDKLYAFVFSMSDGSISKTILPGAVKSVVNNYPDYIMQSGDKAYSLYGKPREESRTDRPDDVKRGFLLTRPLKLSGPVSVKSLRELVNVGCWDKTAGSSIKTQVFVSDNLVDWYDMGSRFGAAAKYFRIALYIVLLPSERLSGTIIWDQERRNENARV